ncbi:MAG: hypothetical protein WD468_07055 [Pirellulales bacterium]
MSSPCVGLRAFVSRNFLVRRGWGYWAIAFAVAAAAPAHAQNKFWITTAGGSFPTAANWSTTAGGAGGATAPAAGEIANFTLANTYTVSFSGNVINAGLVASNGIVTLDLNSFGYTITGATGTTIGTLAAQTGRVIVKDGILGVDTLGDDVAIGTSAGATGFLTISTGGRLGNGTLDPDLVVGSLGTGTFALEDNGRADVAQLNIGQGEGSTGTVSIAGANAALDASGALIVGFSGIGTLNVQNSATLTTATTASIGNLLGGRGTVTVAGAGANWSHTGALTVGDAGDAGLSITSTGQATSAGAVTIGNATTGTGAAVVSGIDSVLNMSSSLNLAVSGVGNMAATGGGRINTTGATTMAGNANSKATLVVTGSGSRWNSGTVLVGSGGTATLSVTNGGVVNSNGSVSIAGQASSTGTATVSGTGSAWNITGPLTVASLGSGTLTVDTGGTLTTTGLLSLFDPAGAPNGTLNFQGGTITAGGFFRNGTSTLNWTDGTFIINGGVLNNGGALLTINGGDGDDLPILRLASGANSNVANLPSITVGSNRQGALIVSGGSSVQTTTASIGSQDGSNGTLLVEGFNSTLSTTGEMNVGGTASTGGGIGTMTLGNGGAIVVGDRLRLWNGALVNMNGGTLTFNTIAPNGGRFNFTSGTVQASANLTANAAVLDMILGTTHELGTGRRLDVPGNSLNLQSDITVNGGTIAGGTLSIGTNLNMRVLNGGNATFTSGIGNPNGGRLFVTDATVSAGTTFSNSGELNLSGSSATVNATGFTNVGLVTGSGRINSVITISNIGQVRVTTGQRLQVLGSAGTTNNDGLIDIDGGTIEFGRAVTNSTVSPSTGLIAARNATLRFSAGLQNSGALTFTAGVSDVFGDVTTLNNLSTPGRIVVTGGAQANFFDDVVNNGSIQVSAAGTLQSTAVFLGSLSGNGVAGTGHVFMEGDMRPGFSPGTMAFGGDLSYGPLATLNIEIAGVTPGTQYDQVTVANDVALSGTLEVTLLGGFKPIAGNSFAILTAGGSIDGTFGNEILPQLSGGLQWGVSYLPQSVSVNVGGVLGDYNLNGVVDAADFVVWRKLLSTSALVADASGNGIVDQADYDVWRANFGQVAALASGTGSAVSPPVAVPEPATAILAGLFAVLLLMPSRRKRQN